VGKLEILKLGNPVLRSVSAPVEHFDAALAVLAQDMMETMLAAPGVGLAAPQVGRPIRLFVFDDGDENRGALCNPVITWRSEETNEAEEGCLSIPGTYFPVVRATQVRVQAQDVLGAPITVEGEGFFARILQHEIDHLDGIMFIDRLAPELRREAQRAFLDQDFGASPPPRRKPSEEL